MKYGKVIEGNVTFRAEGDYSEVEEIKGSLYCSSDATVAFPALTTVCGYLDCRSDATGAFPVLTTVGGSLYCRSDATGAFPVLTTVGGSLYCRSDATGAFPVLTTVGGSLHCSSDATGAFPVLQEKECGPAKATAEVRLAFRLQGFLFVDNILALIKNTKIQANGAQVHRITLVGETKVSFCLEIDGVVSHGDTIQEARESLLYKISSRDKSAYESWMLDKKISKREAIESYRVITGACEAGTRHFVKSIGKTKSKYTVRDVIELTKGQFGNETYKAFFAETEAHDAN